MATADYRHPPVIGTLHTVTPLCAAAPDLLRELQLIEEGWAARERNLPGFHPLTRWERERLMSLRTAIKKATSPQAR